MRTRLIPIAGAVAVAATLTANVRAQTPAPAPTPAPAIEAPAGVKWEGMFSVGGAGTDQSGYPGRVGEYQVVDQDALAALRAQFWGANGGFRYDVSAFNGGDSRSQRYLADLDFNRFVKAHVKYLRFPHRLDHDPLTYMDASSNIGGTFVVRSDDADPGVAYGLARSEFAADVEVALPNVSFFLGHRRQERGGAHQVMTISHCATCHTESYTRRMDELTSDLTAGARVTLRRLTLDYSFLNREFEDEGGPLAQRYDDARHPATLADVFLNRVQYDDGAGLLPFATVPGIRKSSHTVRAALGLPGDASLVGTVTKSNTRNRDTGLEIDYTGGFGRFTVPLGSRTVFRADLRRYDIDADDVFIDVGEPIAPAGPSAGKTYSQAYPALGEVDYLRQSALSRTPTEFNMEVSVRPARRTTLRAGYGWEQVDRKHFEVDKTTTNSFFVAGRFQMGRKANARFRFQYDDVNDPFAYENAAIPQVLQPFASPGSLPFTGLQYFTMYDSRQADLTAYPSRRAKLEGTVTLTPATTVAVTAHYRYNDSKNDELNFSEWGRTAHSPGVDIWIAPGERWALAGGYVHQRERLETLFTTLAFVG